MVMDHALYAIHNAEMNRDLLDGLDTCLSK